MSRIPKNAVYVACIACLFWAQQLGFTPYLTPYMSSLGALSALTGLMLGAFGAAQILFRIPLGIVLDRTSGYKRFMILGNALSAVAIFCMWLFPNPWVIVVMRFFTGVSGATWTCYTVVYGGYFSSSGTMRPLTHLTALNYVGQIIGFLVALFFSSTFDTRAVFLAISVIAVIALILSCFVKPNPIQTERPPVTWKQVASLVRDKKLWVISVLGFLLEFITFSGPLGFRSAYAASIGANNAELALISIIAAAMCALAALFLGLRLVKWLGLRATLTVCMFLMAAYCFLLPLCKSVLAMNLVQIVFSAGQGSALALLSGLAVKDIPYERQAARHAFYLTASSVGMLLGPILTGVISDWVSLSSAFLVVGVIALSGPIVAFFGMKSKKPRSTAA